MRGRVAQTRRGCRQGLEREEQTMAQRESSGKAPDAARERFRENRFGLFIHFGLYSLLGRHEWVMFRERIPASDIARLAAQFDPRPDAMREWVALAWIGCLLLATWLLGLVVSGTLFCFAWLRWHAGERWAFSAVFAAVLGVALWVVFSLLLGADVYAGLLWGSLR